MEKYLLKQISMLAQSFQRILYDFNLIIVVILSISVPKHNIFNNLGHSKTIMSFSGSSSYFCAYFMVFNTWWLDRNTGEYYHMNIFIQSEQTTTNIWNFNSWLTDKP